MQPPFIIPHTMSNVRFEIQVINGNQATVRGLTSDLGGAAVATNTLNNAIGKIGSAAFAFNNIKSAVSGVAADFKAAIQPGIDFNSSLKDLQAITGVSNDQL